MSDPEIRDATERLTEQRLNRRTLIQGTGAAVAAGTAGVAGAVIHPTLAQDATPSAAGSPDAMPGMDMAADLRAAAFFTVHEAATIDALTARLIPGDANDPGAHEAGVVFYIDRSLSGTNLGYDLKTYTQGPFPVTEESQTPVEFSSAPDLYRAIFIESDNISRYGFQSVMSPQEIYRRGIDFLDIHTQATYELDFVDLDTTRQDEVIAALQNNEAEAFQGPSGSAFFGMLRNDTIKGMFSDPMYGGNLGKAGWSLIGYPGAQRFYSADDMKNPSFSREPQSLAEMMDNEGQ